MNLPEGNLTQFLECVDDGGLPHDHPFPISMECWNTGMMELGFFCPEYFIKIFSEHFGNPYV